MKLLILTSATWIGEHAEEDGRLGRVAGLGFEFEPAPDSTAALEGRLFRSVSNPLTAVPAGAGRSVDRKYLRMQTLEISSSPFLQSVFPSQTWSGETLKT